MHAGHILLGRPWQFDRKAIHDGFKNRHSFVKDNRTTTLVPLTPRQVYEDHDGDQVPIGPVTRARVRKFKDVLNGLIQELWA
jgi:hypothetical protein